MRHWVLGALLLSGLFTPATVNAADYYVSSIHSGRSDSNLGTDPSAPWETFEKARTEWGSMQPGDTVYLERGSVFLVSTTHDGNSSFFKVQHGGTEGNPITMTGAGYGSGAMPIIRRTGATGVRTFIAIRDSNVTVGDIELDGAMNAGFATTGVSLWTDGIWDGDNGVVQNVTIQNMYIHNLGGTTSGEERYICGIVMNSTDDFAIDNCLIEGNTISDYSAHGLNDYAGNYSNNIWRNNIVINDYPHRCAEVNSALQTGSGTNVVYEYNYLRDTTLTSSGAAIRIAGKGNDSGLNTVRFNVIVASGHHGISFVQSNQSGPWRMLYDIYGNIVYNCADAGIFMQPGGDWHSSIVNIYNNTLYNNWGSGGSSSDGEITIGNGFADTTLNLANNLIYRTDFGDAACLTVDDSFSSGAFNHGHNLYYRPGASATTVIDDMGTTYSLANVSLYEGSGQNGDPQFFDLGALPTAVSSAAGVAPDGLSLQASSPAIGNGNDLGADYAWDINGNPRMGSWDIGAREYTESPDGGTDPVDASVPADGAAGGNGATGSGSDDAGGCGCTTGSSSHGADLVWGLLLGLGLCRRRSAAVRFEAIRPADHGRRHRPLPR